MSAEKISIRYAKALFELSEKNGSIEQVKGDMTLILNAIDSSEELAEALKSPIIKADKKQSFIKELFGNKIQENTLSLLNLLIEKGREKYTRDVCVSFMDLYNKKNHIIPVKLRTAVAISDQMKKEITANIKGTVQIETTVDASLVGGYIVEYDNQMFDSSVARSITVLKQKFAN